VRKSLTGGEEKKKRIPTKSFKISNKLGIGFGMNIKAIKFSRVFEGAQEFTLSTGLSETISISRRSTKAKLKRCLTLTESDSRSQINGKRKALDSFSILPPKKKRKFLSLFPSSGKQ
jgi:hypothetical protein